MIVPTINQRRIACSYKTRRHHACAHHAVCHRARRQSHAESRLYGRARYFEGVETSVTETSSPPLLIPRRESPRRYTGRPDLWSSSYREFSGWGDVARRRRHATPRHAKPNRVERSRGNLSQVVCSACKFIRRENTRSTIEKSPRRVMGALAWSVHPVTLTKFVRICPDTNIYFVYFSDTMYMYSRFLFNIRVKFFIERKKWERKLLYMLVY